MSERKARRVVFKVDVDLKYNDTVAKGELENISLKGMFVALESSSIPLDAAVDIVLKLTGVTSDLKLEVKGKVIRKEENGIALEFVKIDFDSFVHLKNIITYNLSDKDEILKEYNENITQ